MVKTVNYFNSLFSQLHFYMLLTGQAFLIAHTNKILLSLQKYPSTDYPHEWIGPKYPLRLLNILQIHWVNQPALAHTSFVNVVSASRCAMMCILVINDVPHYSLSIRYPVNIQLPILIQGIQASNLLLNFNSRWRWGPVYKIVQELHNTLMIPYPISLTQEYSLNTNGYRPNTGGKLSTQKVKYNCDFCHKGEVSSSYRRSTTLSIFIERIDITLSIHLDDSLRSLARARGYAIPPTREE